MKLLTEGLYAWHVSEADLAEFDDELHNIVNGHLYGLGTYYEIGRPDKNYDAYHRGRNRLTQYKVWVNLKDNQLLDLSGTKSLNQINKPLTLNQIMLLHRALVFQPKARDIIDDLLKMRNDKEYYIDPDKSNVIEQNKDYALYSKISYLKNILWNMIDILYPHKNNSDEYWREKYEFTVGHLRRMGLYDYFKLADSGQSSDLNPYKYHIKNDDDFITLTKFASKLEAMLFPLLTKVINAAPMMRFFEYGFDYSSQIKLIMSMLGVYGIIVDPESTLAPDIRYLILWKNKGIVSVLGRRKKIHQQFDDEAEAQEIADWIEQGDSGAF